MTFTKGNKHGTKWGGKKPTLRSLKDKCWRLFSEYVRRKYSRGRVFGDCFTCGRTKKWSALQCGHAIGGRNNAVLFDEEICRPQCVGCNVFMRGNYPIFTTKLIKENSMEWWEAKLEGSRRAVKYTQADIEEMIRTYQGKLSDLR